MVDTVIVGAGVIGLTLAYRLAEQGGTVAVLEQGSPGQEASWAGAGILPPGNPRQARTAEARLRAGSHLLWPELSAQLREETGIDNGFRICGGLELRADPADADLAHEIAHWRDEGVVVESLDGAGLRECEPNLGAQVRAGYRLPEMGQVRNPRHLKALITGCLRRGVQLQAGSPVVDLPRHGERVTGVRTPDGIVAAGQVVVTSGAWTARVLAALATAPAIVPVRGQIVLLTLQPAPLTHVLNVGPRYLVPRSDGRTLIGATEELAGFDKRNTGQGVGGLLSFAAELVPLLEQATFERCWAGLRPKSPDGLPYLGAVPGFDNLYVAAGHFRAGLQLSPITARLMTQVLRGQSPDLDLSPYAVDRPMPAVPAAH